MQKEHTILLGVNLVLIIGFGAFFLARMNYEFIIYVGIIVLALGLIAISINRVTYSLDALIGLTAWSALHLAGGGVAVGNGRLYDVLLVRLSAAYPIFRYDQLVHVWGFGVSTLVMFSLLNAGLKRPIERRIGLWIVLVMAGLGMGALNEIIEFLVSILVPRSGVGGYINTSLDLCADFIGALLGVLYIRLRFLPKSGSRRPNPATQS